MTTPYPLAWPEGVRRTKAPGKAQFRTSLAGALANVRHSLAAFGRETGLVVDRAVISSNVSLGNQAPADGGIAVWFVWDGEMRCLAIDRYASPQDNLQALHHIIEARRTEMRHGTLDMVRAAFKGFAAALPAPATHWQELDLAPGATVAAIEERFRALAKERHPDVGGTSEAMARLTAARAAALKEVV